MSKENKTQDKDQQQLFVPEGGWQTITINGTPMVPIHQVIEVLNKINCKLENEDETERNVQTRSL